MKITMLVMTLFASLLATTAIGQTGKYYGVWWDGSMEYFTSIDPYTSQKTIIATLPEVKLIVAGNSAFASDNNRYVFVGGGTTSTMAYYVIDAGTGAVISKTLRSEKIDNIAYSPADKTFYGLWWDGSTEHFVSIDPYTSTKKIIAAIPGVTLIEALNYSFASDCNNRYVFVGGSSGSAMSYHVIDVATGAVISKSPRSEAIRNIAYSSTDDAFYGLWWDGSTEYLAEIDPYTSIRRNIQSIPGVALIAAGNSAFDFNSNRYVFIGGATTSALSYFVMNATTGGVVSQILRSEKIDNIQYGGPLPTPRVSTPPKAVTCLSGNAHVAVAWRAPGSNGGSAITGYTVTSNPHGKTCMTAGGTGCSVTGLTNGTAYTFTVTATNAFGISPASVASGTAIPTAPATVPGAPTSVTGVAGNAQVVVSWSGSACSSCMLATGYTATSNPDGKTCSAASAMTCTVTGLTNGTAYTFTVVGTNSSGNGPASIPSVPVTPTAPIESCPGFCPAPTGVLGMAGNAQVVVSWIAAPSGSPTGYTVTSNPDGKNCSTAGAVTCTVTGLTNGTAYTFTVIAFYSAGAGLSSTPSAAVTPIASIPPSITNQPIAATVVLNPGAGVARFGIKATGSATLTYKWVRMRGTVTDTLIAGGTGLAAIFSMNAVGDTLTIINAPRADSGTTYKCVVRNSVGVAVSNAGVLRLDLLVSIWSPHLIRIRGISPFTFHFPSNTSGVRISVMNIWGRTLWSHDVSAGVSELSWNGRTAGGAALRGVYLVRIANASRNSQILAESKVMLLP